MECAADCLVSENKSKDILNFTSITAILGGLFALGLSGRECVRTHRLYRLECWVLMSYVYGRYRRKRPHLVLIYNNCNFWMH